MAARKYTAKEKEAARLRNNARRRAAYASNPAPARECTRKWRDANKDHRARYTKAYYQANKDQINANSRKRLAAAGGGPNRGEELKRYRRANPEKAAAHAKKYREKNPEKFRAIYAKYRAAKQQATVAWADYEAIELIYLEAQIKSLNGVKYHVDHIIPLQHELICGLHCEDNLQVITGAENIAKSNTFE